MYWGIVPQKNDVYQLISKVHILLLLSGDFPEEIIAKSILCRPLQCLSSDTTLGRYNTIDLTCLPFPTDSCELLAELARLSKLIPNLSVLIPSNCRKWWNLWDTTLRTNVDVALKIINGTCIDVWSVEHIQYVWFPEQIIAKVVEQFDTFFIVNSIPRLKQLKAAASHIDHNRDLLIDPLQPLTVLLTHDIYAQFHKDPVKYKQYGNAMALAISDLNVSHINVLIVGPGMGQLIDELLSIKTDVLVSVVAIEKNHLCMDHLEKKNQTVWKNKVHLIQGDVRYVTIPVDPHIVVSELLGSFGDNELCPEILKRFTTTKVMIPSSYTSYLQPVYTSVRPDIIDRPYLVQLSKYYPVDDYQVVWEFEHPSLEPTHREATLKFQGHGGFKLNGFYGYFSANLYGHFNIHINPRLSSEEYCSSWFPMLFPVIELELGDEQIELKICRKMDTTRVWYEWVLMGTTYNQNGSFYSMNL
jgi:protein arginine N-methyltransferase 5